MTIQEKDAWLKSTSHFSGLCACALAFGCYSGVPTSANAGGDTDGEGPAGSTDGETANDNEGETDTSADETEGPESEPDPDEPALVSTPLARLTNEEVVAAVDRLLFHGLPDSPGAAGAASALAAEPRVGGLSSDAERQLMTHIAVSGYSRFAAAVADQVLVDISSPDEFDAHFGCEPLTADETNEPGLPSDCVQRFAERIVSGAFRREIRPQEGEDLRVLLEAVDDILTSHERSLESLEANTLRVRAVLRYILMSPDFLLFIERGDTMPGETPDGSVTLTSFEIAARMSFFLTGGLPDPELRRAAESDLLRDPEVRAQHAERMLADGAGSDHVATLLGRWMEIEPEVVSQESADDLHDFVESWFADKRPFSDLYQADVVVPHLDETESTEPFGILGLSAFVGSHTTFPTPGFITRGVFVVERLLCSALPDGIPVDAFDSEEMTPLEVFEDHVKQPCATCHVVFDNYGATFQKYDEESGLYDPDRNTFGEAFELLPIGDVSGTASGIEDLSATIGSSERAQFCMTELWYRHAMRRSVEFGSIDEEALEGLAKSWRDSGESSLQSLLLQIVSSEDFATLRR